MFENVGKKIQGIAKAVFISAIVISVISCGISLLALLFDDFGAFCIGAITAPIAIFVVGLAAWIDALLLYGFGKIIEDVGAIRASLSQTTKVVKAETVKPAVPDVPDVSATPAISVESQSPFVSADVPEAESDSALCCPVCKEDLTFMGWDEAEITNSQVCPFCKNEIKLK